jgi:hypothetical protein
MESTVRYLGIEVDDALAIAEQVERELPSSGLTSAFASYGYVAACALVCDVPIATKASKLPSYSMSLVATAYLRVAAALLAVRGIRATRFMECRRTGNAPTPA